MSGLWESVRHPSLTHSWCAGANTSKKNKTKDKKMHISQVCLLCAREFEILSGLKSKICLREKRVLQ